MVPVDACNEHYYTNLESGVVSGEEVPFFLARAV